MAFRQARRGARRSHEEIEIQRRADCVRAATGPSQGRAGAYLITNDRARTYSTMSVSDLEKMVGLRLLPGVLMTVRDAGMSLPQPSSQSSRHPGKQRPGRGGSEEWSQFRRLQDLPRLILDAIRGAAP